MSPLRYLSPTSAVVRFALGLAASGVAAAFLGGSALADTSTDTQSQTTQVNESSNVVVSTTNSAQTSVGQSSTIPNPPGSSVDAPKASTGGMISLEQPKADTALPTALSTPVTPVTKAASDNGAQATSKSPDGLTQVVTAAPVQPTNPPGYSGNTFSLIAIGGTYLPIQPAITSVGSVNDLASATPSAPSPTKAPVKTSALFGVLAASLATTIVPGFTHIYAIVQPNVSARLAIQLTLLLLTLLLLVTFVQTLRRSGFTNGARSDLPNSYFASPYLLGYVPALRRGT